MALLLSGDYQNDVHLGGEISSALLDLHHLKDLDLSENDFGGNRIPDFLCSMTQLQHLKLSLSNFSGIVPPQLGNLTSLQTLDLKDNYFTGVIPPQLGNLTNLQTLALERNKLKTLPSSIWQLSKLKKLDVSSNSLEGTITEAKLTKLHNLKLLDLSFNSLTLDINPDWTPPFQLDLIGLAGCNMGPSFPLWLRKQSNFWWLDLSSNGISGDVPNWLWSLSSGIDYLNISHNEFSGTMNDYSRTISMIDVSFNKFSGHIPLLHPSTSIFQLSQNMFSGSISSLCPMPRSRLWLLDLSDNRLEGELPNCWQNMTRLYVLNLSNNNFSGEIPHALGSLLNLYALQLDNNNLSGELPSTLNKPKHLQLIDVGGNKLTGNIPTWIDASHEHMAYLIFRNNRFEGSIPPQICSLTQIQVLDLSGNHISGKIPPCFNNFTYLVQKDMRGPIFFRFFSLEALHFKDYIYYATLSWKHQELEYKRNLRLLKLIDLSRNRLVGDIPGSFSSLKRLVSLNLSRNCLTGNINPDIGQMEMLDSLDLSSNQLSGAIPSSMTRLTFLSVLDLANNNLSGKIPTSTQLQSFNASAYAGNVGLCGSPLPLCPGDDPHPSTNNEAGDTDDEKDDDGILSSSFLKEIVISIIVGYIFGFWGVVGSLIVKESWRRAYFNFWDAVGNWLYVTAAVSWNKFRRS
ncbi:LRR receptor-like serine/threonine-protein kinase fls2 [Phtheirospermum japonicum]|uniref:LRR receptor-like serine/threonine-protein kinase fls2 n=1 Tax=Phtheirospermum japonicum TaxID=374723 RepID=A0A830AZA5_9LAMI|nr:LRR receptor-like serine/threonine-protein kinase fls2 [Phtheirospermum japonicum]